MEILKKRFSVLVMALLVFALAVFVALFVPPNDSAIAGEVAGHSFKIQGTQYTLVFMEEGVFGGGTGSEAGAVILSHDVDVVSEYRYIYSKPDIIIYSERSPDIVEMVLAIDGNIRSLAPGFLVLTE